MESLDNSSEATGFVKHVFKFDDASKADMLNIVQYALVALIPVVIVNKAMATYVPQADDNKGNIEITLEIVLQVSLMFWEYSLFTELLNTSQHTAVFPIPNLK